MSHAFEPYATITLSKEDVDRIGRPFMWGDLMDKLDLNYDTAEAVLSVTLLEAK